MLCSRAFKMLTDSILQVCSLFSPGKVSLDEQLHSDRQADHESCLKAKCDSFVMWFTCNAINQTVTEVQVLKITNSVLFADAHDCITAC